VILELILRNKKSESGASTRLLSKRLAGVIPTANERVIESFGHQRWC
jgi:hypothetical protein